MAEISIQELNKAMVEAPAETIAAEDGRYASALADIADRVKESGNIRVILLAGPSGSGKTTSANMLADAIRRRKIPAFVVSLDDFYRPSTDPDYPTFENGELDYECVDALSVSDIVKTLTDIAEERPYSIPKFDFKVGARVSEANLPPIGDGCVIIEGLHALNPKILEQLPQDKILKLFISVSTNITKNGEIILSGKKLRFVRRLVRDNIYRAADARKTLEMWDNVLQGEELYLYPYRHLADISLNTFHRFELSIMKPYADKLLTDEVTRESEYARIVHAAFSESVSVSCSLLPESSLLREFIPGGIYEDIY